MDITSERGRQSVIGGSIESRIEKIRSSATKSQKKLIEYLSSTNYEKIIYLSITELAEVLDVAEATILRFCRLLGFSGYQEFKLNLAQEVSSKAHDYSESEYIRGLRDNYVTSLDLCYHKISAEQIDRAIDYIAAARTICCFGVGNSHVAAIEMHNRLLKMGIYVQYEPDAHQQNVLLSSCGAEDLLIVFSVSGGTKDVIDAAALARTRGMKIIVLTSRDKSPLTKYADITISSEFTEAPDNAGTMSAKIVQLYLVDILCTGTYLRDKEKYDNIIAKSNVSVVSKLI